ncbi:MAG: hypothetical protein JWQ09_1737, partial [Segetibacter sp.]|nr:hypothetical protein [Segetibacter sp.]
MLSFTKDSNVTNDNNAAIKISADPFFQPATLVNCAGHANAIKAFFPGVPAISISKKPAANLTIQRIPFDSEDDPIHRPIIDQYHAEHGLEEGEGPSDAEIKYGLTTPTGVLNHEMYTSSFYRAAVQAWPESSSIWDVLTNRQAKINLVRYILSFDQTNCVRYNALDNNVGEGCSPTASAVTSFSNACQGYASQMYARYTSTGRLSAGATQRLQDDAHITIGTVPVKFRMPIRIVTVPGHAFNSVLIDTNPADVNSWLFFEPQNDHIFFASDPILADRNDIYAGSGLFNMSRLTDYASQQPGGVNQFMETVDNDFVLNSSGQFTSQTLSDVQRLYLGRIYAAIFIADDISTFTFTVTNQGTTYEQHVALALSDVPVEHLVLAFRHLNGRTYRTTVGGPLITMDRTHYLQLLN